MRSSAQRKTAIFLHIPKTAGTTLHSILSWQYWGKPSFWVPRSDHRGKTLRALSEERRRGLHLLRGHLLYGIHEALPGPAKYFTMLRHPVGHVRSQYDYYRARCRGEVWQYKTLRSILLNEDALRLDNVQVRWLSGMGNQKDRCDRSDFEQARDNIESHFYMVGLVERFDESLILMKRRLQWQRPLFYRSANVNHADQHKASITDELTSLILRTSKWDLKLYEWVKERFNATAQSKNDLLEQGVERMKKNSRYLGPALDVWRRVKSTFR